MKWSYDGYKIDYQVAQVASPHGWAILDDFFPNLLTGFRIAEYNAYLQRFPLLSIYSTLADFGAQWRKYSRLYPELSPKVKRFSRWDAPRPSFAYLNFLNNAADFLPFLERSKTPG